MKTTRWLIALLILLIAGGIFASARHFNKPKASIAAASSSRDSYEAAVTNQIVADGPVRYVRFTLFDQGIRPARRQIKAGLIHLAIEDKTMDSDGLIVRRLVGDQAIVLGRIRNTPNHRRGRNLIQLLPGTYELQDAIRPANKAIVTVEQ
jgi:hypothetical protein